MLSVKAQARYRASLEAFSPAALLLALLAGFSLPISSHLPAIRPADSLLPTPLATGGLRSLRTSCCLNHRPHPGERFAAWAPASFAAFRRWKFLQFDFTLPAIHAFLILGTVPKTTAPLANFQMHAQFHDCFSVFASSPDGLSMVLVVPRGEENQARQLRFLRP